MQLVDRQLHFPDGHHHGGSATKLQIEKVNFFYGAKQALFDVSLAIYANEVTAFIGPSGCGKTTLLRCLNRMNDIVPDVRLEGRIAIDGEDIYQDGVDPVEIRRRFGWVAQKPNPFPDSIYDNIVYGARVQGKVRSRSDADVLVEASLRRAGMWNEVKDRLKVPGTDLSGGQQQRLCIARAIAPRPDIILMDEPCSALDPVATAKIEELIDELRHDFTIVIITHNMQQAARVSQRTAFFHLGEMVEAGDTETLFINPQDDRTRDYITGRFG